MKRYSFIWKKSNASFAKMKLEYTSFPKSARNLIHVLQFQMYICEIVWENLYYLPGNMLREK
jgi:hypothetical protein